jgi:hypothetical protein
VLKVDEIVEEMIRERDEFDKNDVDTYSKPVRLDALQPTAHAVLTCGDTHAVKDASWHRVVTYGIMFL